MACASDGSKTSEDHHVLAEFTSLDDLILPIKSSARIKYTCLSVCSSYIVCGTNSGSLYVFMKDDLSYRHLIPTEGDGAVTQVLFNPKDENVIAYGTSKGAVIVAELSLKKIAKHERLRHTKNHDGSAITALVWNHPGNKLFAGDSSGNVSVVNVSAVKAKDLVQIPSSMILKNLDSSIVQLHCNAEKLLVSTLTRSHLCNTEKSTFTQIGKRLRDGPFGACFFQVSKSQTPIIYCARPGSRVWEVDYDGGVLNTHQFKKLLAAPPCPVISLNSETLTNSGKDVRTQSTNFRKLLIFGQQYLATWSDCGLYVINPVQVKLLLWTNQFTDIQDVVCHHNDLYLYHGSNNITKITMLPVEKCIARLFVKKRLILCAELCQMFSSHVSLARCRYHIPVSLLNELREYLISAEMNGHAEKIGSILQDLQLDNESEQCKSVSSSRRSSFSSIDSSTATRLESGIYVVRTRSMIGYDYDDEKSSISAWSKGKGLLVKAAKMRRSGSVSSEMSELSLESDTRSLSSVEKGNETVESAEGGSSQHSETNTMPCSQTMEGHKFVPREVAGASSGSNGGLITPDNSELLATWIGLDTEESRKRDLSSTKESTELLGDLDTKSLSNMDVDVGNSISDSNIVLHNQFSGRSAVEETEQLVCDTHLGEPVPTVGDVSKSVSCSVKVENPSESMFTNDSAFSVHSLTNDKLSTDPCKISESSTLAQDASSTIPLPVKNGNLSEFNNTKPSEFSSDSFNQDLSSTKPCEILTSQMLSPTDSGFEMDDPNPCVEPGGENVGLLDQDRGKLEVIGHGDSGYHDDRHRMVDDSARRLEAGRNTDVVLVEHKSTSSKTSSRRSSLTSLSSNELMFGATSMDQEPVIAKSDRGSTKRRVIKKRASVAEILTPGQVGVKTDAKKISRKKRANSSALDMSTSKTSSPSSASGGSPSGRSIKSESSPSDAIPTTQSVSPREQSHPTEGSPSTDFLSKTSFLNFKDRISSKTKTLLQKVKDSKLLKKEDGDAYMDDVFVTTPIAHHETVQLDNQQVSPPVVDLTALDLKTMETREKLADPSTSYNPALLKEVLADWMKVLHASMNELHCKMHQRKDHEMVDKIDDEKPTGDDQTSESEFNQANSDPTVGECNGDSMVMAGKERETDNNCAADDEKAADDERVTDNEKAADNEKVTDNQSETGGSKQTMSLNLTETSDDSITAKKRDVIRDVPEKSSEKITTIKYEDFPADGELYLTDPFKMDIDLHKMVSEVTMLCLEMGLVESVCQLTHSNWKSMRSENSDSCETPTDEGSEAIPENLTTNDGAKWKYFIRCYFHFLDIGRLRKTLLLWPDDVPKKLVWQTLVDCLSSVDDVVSEKIKEQNLQGAFDMLRSGVQNKMATISHVTRLFSIDPRKTINFCIEMRHLLSPLELLYLTENSNTTSTEHFQHYMKSMFDKAHPNDRKTRYRSLCNNYEVEQRWMELILQDEEQLSCCQCGWPSPGSHLVQYKQQELLDAIVQFTERNEMVMDTCRKYGYWKGYLQLCSGVISKETMMKILLQLGDIETIQEYARQGTIFSTKEDWKEMIQLRGRQSINTGQSESNNQNQDIHCLNCHSVLTYTKPMLVPVDGSDSTSNSAISWESIARLVVKNVGPGRACEILMTADIPEGELSVEFYQSCVLATLLENKQRLVTHRILEKSDTYLWSKRSSHLPPEIILAVDNEKSVVKGRENTHAADINEGLFSFLSSQSRSQQRVLEESQIHWGQRSDLSASCAICSIALVSQTNTSQTGIIIHPCGHSFHKQCTPDQVCLICARNEN